MTFPPDIRILTLKHKTSWEIIRVKTDGGDVLSIEVGDCVLHNAPDTTLDRDNQYLKMRLMHAGRAVELT